MNHDFALGTAVQLIKDIRRMASSEEITEDPFTCLDIRLACEDWLKTYGTSNDTTVKEEGDLGGGNG